MKEFEKWAGPGFYYGKDPSNRPTLEAKRKAWKAALEWFNKTAEHLSPSDCDLIDQELNDQT